MKASGANHPGAITLRRRGGEPLSILIITLLLIAEVALFGVAGAMCASIAALQHVQIANCPLAVGGNVNHCGGAHE